MSSSLKKKITLILLCSLSFLYSSCKKEKELEPEEASGKDLGTRSFDCTRPLTPELLRGDHHHSRVPIPGKYVGDKSEGHFVLLSGDHTHKFFISKGDFERMAKGELVVINESDGLNHGHQISLECP